MNNVTEMKANEFDGIPVSEMTEEMRLAAIRAELIRLGFDDPDWFMSQEAGWRMTAEETKGLDDRVYNTLENKWDDLCDSIDDEHITDGEDWISDEDDYWLSTGSIWDRYIQPCKHKDGSCTAYEGVGEMFDWTLDIAKIDNIPIGTANDSPFGESYDRVEEIFNRYKRLAELDNDGDYFAWDAMIADCVHGKNDILDEIAFCAVLIKPDMWDDEKLLDKWRSDARWNYNCRKYGV